MRVFWDLGEQITIQQPVIVETFCLRRNPGLFSRIHREPASLIQ